MPVTVVATVGASDSNSFVTLSEANTFADSKLPSPTAWDAASDDTCNRALVSATRWLSALLWLGTRVDATQALSWPRTGVVDVDDPDENEYDTDEIPQRVKDATCELAILMVAAGTSDLAAAPSTDGIIRKRVDVIETEFAPSYERASDIDRFPTVTRLLVGLLLETGGPTVPLARA